MSNLSNLKPRENLSKTRNFMAGTAISVNTGVYLQVDGTVDQISSDTQSAEFIGISTSTVSINNPVDIIMKGGIVTGLSGLTPKSTYYVSATGALTTSATSIVAGKAITSSSVLLTGE